jgi:hypothetical protein
LVEFALALEVLVLAAVVERSLMAKKKTGRPPKPAGEPVQVRIDADLAEKARYLAAFKRVSMTDYLSGILRPALERDEKEAGKKMMGGDA